MKGKKPIGQVVLLEPPKKEGSRVLVVQGNHVEEGTVRGIQDGQPLNGGDLVHLGLHPQSPVVYNLLERESFSNEEQGGTSGNKGPAKVTSREYRENYDQIFGKEDGDALPN